MGFSPQVCVAKMDFLGDFLNKKWTFCRSLQQNKLWCGLQCEHWQPPHDTGYYGKSVVSHAWTWHPRMAGTTPYKDTTGGYASEVPSAQLIFLEYLGIFWGSPVTFLVIVGTLWPCVTSFVGHCWTMLGPFLDAFLTFAFLLFLVHLRGALWGRFS